MPSSPDRHPLTSYAANLRRLVVFRLFLHGGELLVALGLALVGPPAVSSLGLGVLVAISFLVNTATAWRLARAPGAIPGAELLGQLTLDVANLFGVFYFTGGAANPFAFLLLLPVVLGATALPERQSWALTGTAIAAYTALLFFHRPFPGLDPNPGEAIRAHIWGMWLGFVLGAGLAAYFLVRMGSTLRAHDRRLAQERERALRDEHVLALGTLAAGTAHELATPLGTLLLLIQELEEDPDRAETDRQRLTEMRTQVERCRQALDDLAVRSGQLRAEEGRAWSLPAFLGHVVDQWRDRRPEAAVRLNLLGEANAPVIVADRALAQALTNILDNAADASPDDVTVRARASADEAIVEVYDRGPGIETGENTGQWDSADPSGTRKGLGLGLFLTDAIIGRLGGTLELENRSTGGACARVRIPLPRLGKAGKAEERSGKGGETWIS